jgi:hypothetical protein
VRISACGHFGRTTRARSRCRRRSSVRLAAGEGGWGGGASSSVRAKGVTAMRLVHGRGDVGLEWTRWGRTEGVVAVGAAPELPWGDVARRDVRLSPHRAHRECTIAYS